MAELIEARVCRTCPVPHYENCPRCFGFGVRSDGSIISSAEAFDDPPADAMPCPVCDSTVKGVPHLIRHSFEAAR